MAHRLEAKVAIITGAGQGIGEATARAFAREGASVIIAERNAETGARGAVDLTAAGQAAIFGGKRADIRASSPKWRC